MYIQMLLLVLVSLVEGTTKIPCWARNNAHENVVGFDIGITHGTVTVALANGSFLDVVRLEAGPAYQARVLERLQNEGLVKVNQSLSRYQDVAKDWSLSMRYFETILRFFRSLMRRNAPKSAAVDTFKERHRTNPVQLELDALILGMKAQMEKVLKRNISLATVTTPNLLPHAHRAEIMSALSKASLNLYSCGGIEDSLIASTIATRFFQHNLQSRENSSHAECLLGQYTVEEVIAVSYTRGILVLSVFKIYIGLKTWTIDEMRHFVAIGDFLQGVNSEGLDGDLTFSADVTTGMRKSAIRFTTVDDHTLRLVLQGPSSLQPQILLFIESAFGKLIPNASYPLGVHMIFNDDENSAARKELRYMERAFLCALTDPEGEWRVKDYERDLLRSIVNVDDSFKEIGEGFLASRGAAIMALHFLDLSCEERRLALQRPWSRDNNRSSTLWYPEDDDDELFSLVNY